MPVFDWVFGTKDIPGQRRLAATGPRISIEATIHPVMQRALTDAGVSMPAPVPGIGLIDTGASITSIDVSVAQRLNLQVVGTRKLGTARGVVDAPLFSFTLRLLPWGFNLNCVPGVGCDIHAQGIIALIGMDLLSQCVLTVHGPMGVVSIAV
jgi:hypothetical protein